MMEDENQTSWTPGPEDNKLGITDSNRINELEAEGLIKAELFIFDLDENIEISASLLLNIHKIAFGSIYEWAGKWRQTEVRVGKLNPPHPTKVPDLIYQFIDNLNFKIRTADSLYIT